VIGPSRWWHTVGVFRLVGSKRFVGCASQGTTRRNRHRRDLAQVGELDYDQVHPMIITRVTGQKRHNKSSERFMIQQIYAN